MNNQLAEVIYRRRVLMERIEIQRTQVFKFSQQWDKPLAVVDAGVKVVKFMSRHHAFVTSILAWLLAWRRNRNARHAQKG